MHNVQVLQVIFLNFSHIQYSFDIVAVNRTVFPFRNAAYRAKCIFKAFCIRPSSLNILAMDAQRNKKSER